MTTAIAVKSFIELAVVLLLIYGFYKEDKVIAFEHRVKIIIVVNYRRYKKRKKLEAMRRKQQLTVYDGGKPTHTKKGSYHIA